MFDRDLTKSMHCIVPSGSKGSSVFGRGLICNILFPVKERE